MLQMMENLQPINTKIFVPSFLISDSLFSWFCIIQSQCGPLILVALFPTTFRAHQIQQSSTKS